MKPQNRQKGSINMGWSQRIQFQGSPVSLAELDVQLLVHDVLTLCRGSCEVPSYGQTQIQVHRLPEFFAMGENDMQRLPHRLVRFRHITYTGPADTLTPGIP